MVFKMKKILALLTAAALLVSFAACGNDDDDSSNQDNVTLPQGAVNGHFATLNRDGVEYDVVLGSCIEKMLDAVGHPGDDRVVRTESCGFRGFDYVYRFGSIEVSTFSPDGSANHILSVRLIDDGIYTGNGAHIGMAVADIVSLYGQPSEITGTGNRYRYLKDGMSLEFLITNGVAEEIVYRFEDSDEYRIDL
jgi:hypothetical protein